MVKKACVLGAGSWGTALAHHLANGPAQVVLWGRDKTVLRSIAEGNKNPHYFPDIPLSPKIKVSEDLTDALDSASLVVFAVPSAATREIAKLVSPALPNEAIIVSTAKGLEQATSSTMISVLAEELPAHQKLSVLAGPSFALEVVQGLPTAVTIAAQESSVAESAAEFFHHSAFRIYTSTDVIGVELGGIIKNVIALAAGIVDGVGMGNNARAALITRGIAEMQRLVVAFGGNRRTVAGLSGLGDLLLTATGDLSRNRQVGLRLGKGESLEQIVNSLGQVAEAVKTAPKLYNLAKNKQVSVPIIEQVNAILEEKVSIEEALSILLAREQKAEVLDLL